MKFLLKYLLVLLLVHSSMVSARTFIHPGLSHKQSDLERIKALVEQNKEPWSTSFSELQTSSYASYNYTVRWSLDSTRVIEGVAGNYEKFKYDALACYYNALEWVVTGDSRYAAKSVEILNKMRNIRNIVSATESLCAGRVLPKLLEGAEIIRHSYSGWAQSDIEAFEAMLVYPGYSTTVDHSLDAEHSFYWAMFNGDYGRHGNQGLFGMLGALQIAVFSNNEIMYDRILRYMKGQSHRADDLPYVSGPTNVKSTKNAYPTSNSYFDDYSLNTPYILNTVPDYGYNEVLKNYIWENGQTQEASRDQSHPQLALGLIHNICEIAWNQGDDLYSILNYRPLLGVEYLFKYNLSYVRSFPDQSSPWEPTVATGEFIQRRDRSQRWFSRKINPWNANDTTTLTRGKCFSDASYTSSTGPKTPMYEMMLGHYRSRLNLPASQFKWLNRSDSISRQTFGYERQGFQVDYLGFGTLTFRRVDQCPGDPCTFNARQPVYAMHSIPGVVQAEDFDFFVANGEGRTFHELSGTKTYNAYRPDSAVTVLPCTGGGYKVGSIASGEWISYTVQVPTTGFYKISVNYAASTSGGKFKLTDGANDLSAPTTLPVTGSENWTTCSLTECVLLNAGIQSLRIEASGTTNALELNSLQVSTIDKPVSIRSGNWSDVGTWSTGMVPTEIDTVEIAVGHTITLSADKSCKRLIIRGNGLAGNYVLQTGELSVQSTGAVTLPSTTILQGNLELEAGEINLSNGTLTLKQGTTGEGTVDASNGTLVYGGTSPQTLSNLKNNLVNNLTITNTNEVNLPSILTASAITIGPGGKLTLGEGHSLTATSIQLQSNSAGTATFNDQGTSSIGSATVQQYLTAGRNWYLSSPLSASTSNTFKAGIGNKLWSFSEALQSWPEITQTTTPLLRMTGYVASVASTGTYTYSGGTLNTGTQTIGNLSRTGSTHAKRGFVLLGNPYPSWVNWSNASKSNLSTSMWYRTKNTAGSYVYETFNGSVGTGTNVSGYGAVTADIPPMQAFWGYVPTDGLTGSLTFENTLRSHQNSVVLRKVELVIPMLRLQISNNKQQDETLLLFHPKALPGMDEFDSPKLTNGSSQIPEIYSLVDNQELVMNVMPPIQADTSFSIWIRIGTSGNYTLTLKEFVWNDPSRRLYLLDRLTNSKQDLTENPTYTFQSTVTNGSDRFELTLADLPTQVSETDRKEPEILVEPDGSLVLQCNPFKRGQLWVYDSSGRLVIEQEINQKEPHRTKALFSGFYVAKIQMDNKRVIRKIYILP